MYYLFTALTVFSCVLVCSEVFCYEYNNSGIKNVGTGPSVENDKKTQCALRAAADDAPKMPIPFTTNGRKVSIIYPDSEGQLIVKYMQSFKLACAGVRFDSLPDNGTEAIVTCMGQDSLRYRGKTYKYEEFKCTAMPKSKLRVTDDKCHKDYAVAAVGFQTKYHFLELYYVCFDTSTKNSLYSWYDSRSPYYDNHQKLSNRPPFVKSKELFGNTDVNRKYTFDEQKKTLAKILGSDEQAGKYVRNDKKHFLSRGHYAAKADFFFAYEQSATFYFANVAPQWQLFNGKLWADLEDTTRHKLSNDTSRHLIVTGTYGSCTLPDVNGVQQPLYLDLPESIPVPLFYWKLYYDLDEDDGVVYIGLNNPYKDIDEDVYICPNICPGGFKTNAKKPHANKDEPDANNGLVYCCTKKDFEQVYGQLDPIVFVEKNTSVSRA